MLCPCQRTSPQLKVAERLQHVYLSLDLLKKRLVQNGSHFISDRAEIPSQAISVVE